MKIADLYRSMPARYPEVRGQVAVVTGSSRNIGAGIATRLAREGMRVVISGHIKEEVDAVAAELRDVGAETFAVTGDLSSAQAVDDLFDQTLKQYGTVDVLVNNAADLRRVKSEVVTREMIDYQFELNMKAPLLCSL